MQSGQDMLMDPGLKVGETGGRKCNDVTNPRENGIRMHQKSKLPDMDRRVNYSMKNTLEAEVRRGQKVREEQTMLKIERLWAD
jgi:hypothetical protein